MQVKDIMKTDVKTIGPGSSVQTAAEKMDEHGIGCLIVIEKDKMSGIITERDIIIRLVSKDLKASNTKISEIMSTEMVMIGPEKDVTEAAQIMTDRKIKKLPVIDGDSLVGILTLADICAVQPELIKKVASLLLLPKKKPVAG